MVTTPPRCYEKSNDSTGSSRFSGSHIIEHPSVPDFGNSVKLALSNFGEITAYVMVVPENIKANLVAARFFRIIYFIRRVELKIVEARKIGYRKIL